VLYTREEKKLLTVRPGITDFASIVFADEGEILRGSRDPDLRYNQVIRPWKSRLGLLYVRHAGSVLLDLRLILLTALSAIDRQRALDRVSRIVGCLSKDRGLAAVASRRETLAAAPPPGADRVVEHRGV